MYIPLLNAAANWIYHPKCFGFSFYLAVCGMFWGACLDCHAALAIFLQELHDGSALLHLHIAILQDWHQSFRIDSQVLWPLQLIPSAGRSQSHECRSFICNAWGWPWSSKMCSCDANLVHCSLHTNRSPAANQVACSGTRIMLTQPLAALKSASTSADAADSCIYSRLDVLRGRCLPLVYSSALLSAKVSPDLCCALTLRSHPKHDGPGLLIQRGSLHLCRASYADMLGQPTCQRAYL